MINRYSKTQIYVNVNENYETFLRNKKLNNLTQYSTFNFSKFEDLKRNNQIFSFVHVVEPFDKLNVLSQKYYNSPDLVWLICYTNGLANETLIQIGTPLQIFGPQQKILGLF